MSKYIVINEISESIEFVDGGVRPSDKIDWTITIYIDDSIYHCKYIKIYNKTPYWESTKVAYINLIKPEYIPVRRKKYWILSDDEVDKLVKYLKIKQPFLIGKPSIYKECLIKYNEMIKDFGINTNPINESMKMPDYSKLKDYNK